MVGGVRTWLSEAAVNITECFSEVVSVTNEREKDAVCDQEGETSQGDKVEGATAT